jgi:hypothetical protein
VAQNGGLRPGQFGNLLAFQRDAAEAAAERLAAGDECMKTSPPLLNAAVRPGCARRTRHARGSQTSGSLEPRASWA